MRERVLPGDGVAVTALAFSPGGVYLASGSSDGTVRLWDPRSGRKLATRRDHTRPVDAFVFSPDGSLLVSADRDARLLMYDIPAGRLAHDLSSMASRVHSTDWTWAVTPWKARELPWWPELAPAAGGGQQVAAAPASRGGADLAYRVAVLEVELTGADQETGGASTSSAAAKAVAENVEAARPHERSPLTVTLTFEPSLEVEAVVVDRVSFTLTPCRTTGGSCPAPELTLVPAAYDDLAHSAAVRTYSEAARKAGRSLSRKLIEDAELVAEASGEVISGRRRRPDSDIRVMRRNAYRSHVPMLDLIFSSDHLGLRQESGEAVFADSNPARRGTSGPVRVWEQVAETAHAFLHHNRAEYARKRLDAASRIWREQAIAAPASARSRLVADAVAFAGDSSAVSWVSPQGLIHLLHLRQSNSLVIFPFVSDSGRGSWSADLLSSMRVKSFSSGWSKWEMQRSDWSFLLAKVFLENLRGERSFLPFAGVYLRTERALFPCVGVLDQGIQRRDGLGGISLDRRGEEARVFIFAVPYALEGPLSLHVLDLPAIALE